MPTEQKSVRFWLKVNRIESLADGIFAISMTLLVLGLDVPDVPRDSAASALHQALIETWPRFEDYALSFLLLALFWISHHRQFHFISRANEPFLWLNIIALMFVALVPFSTSLMSSYDGVRSAALIFEANLMAIGLVYFGMWYYASSDYRLINRQAIDESHIRLGRRINLVVPVVSAVAMGLALFTAAWSEVAYISCPFIIGFMRRRADQTAGRKPAKGHKNRSRVAGLPELPGGK